MNTSVTVKTVLKRGALVAAANWQVTAIQFVADTTVNLLLTVPVLGGWAMISMVLGRDIPGLSVDSLRASLTAVADALRSEPAAFVAFLLSFGVVGVAGSALLFLSKGGTVAVLVAGEHAAGAVEVPPLLLSTVSSGAQFTLDRFHDGCTYHFKRYVKLGLGLMTVYGLSAALYLAVLFGSFPAPLTPDSNTAWTVTAGLASTLLAAWVTLVNFVYLLIQTVIVVDDCGVGQAARRVAAFLRRDPRPVLSVFGLVILLVVGATAVSLVATTSLGLIAFVPFVGLAVVPLQLLAWMFRGLVFQYVELSAVCAYVRLYRGRPDDGVPEPAPDLVLPPPSPGW